MKAQYQDFGGLHEANLSSLDRRYFHHAGGSMSRSEVPAGIADQSTRDFVSHSARASSLNNMMMAERESHSLNRLCSSSIRRTTNGLHTTTNLSHECLRLSESIDCDGNSDVDDDDYDDDEQSGTTRVGCTPGGSNVPFPTGMLSASVRTFLNRTKRMADAKEDSSLRSSATDAETLTVGMKKLPEAPVEIIKPQKTKAQQGGENLVMVAFDANVKEMSHSAIIWALQNVLNRGDVLALVGILDCVKGPLGLRTLIGDHAWIKANRKVVEEEVKLKKQTIRAIPGLDYRCREAGVKLVVDVKAFHRPEVMVIAEAINLEASHVVLDKSLKNKNRKYYLENSACLVTRMRRNGGVDPIILLQDGSIEASSEGSSKQTKVHMSSKDGIKSMTPPSPTSVIPVPLSYRFQTDVFEIKLRPKKQPSSIAPSDHSSSTISTPMSRSSSAPYASSTRPSSVVSSQVRLSFTSSSNHTDDTDEELFSIYHGSTRHNPELLDADLFSLKPELGYESDDLFSICEAPTRRETIALSPSTSTRQHQHSSAVSISDPMPSFQKLTIDPDSSTRRSLNANPSTSCTCSSVDAAVSSSSSSKVNLDVIQLEQLTEATISRLTFVVGLGDAVDVNLSNALQPGEAILVGSSPSALFLLHAEKHLRGLYPFRVSAGPPSLYVAVEGGMAMKLAHLETNQRVVVVNARGQSRAVSVAYTALQRKPLVLVEVQCGGRRQSVMLHHAEFVCLVARGAGGQQIEQTVLPVNKLKVGDKVLLRLQRHLISQPRMS